MASAGDGPPLIGDLDTGVVTREEWWLNGIQQEPPAKRPSRGPQFCHTKDPRIRTAHSNGHYNLACLSKT